MTASRKKKRPYAPPSVVSSEAFERLALGCNGTADTARQKTRGVRCSTQGAS